MNVNTAIAAQSITLACLRTSFNQIFLSASSSGYAQKLSATLLKGAMQDSAPTNHLTNLAKTTEESLPSEMARFTAKAERLPNDAGIHLYLARLPSLIPTLSSSAAAVYISDKISPASAQPFAAIAKECAQAHEEFETNGNYSDLRQKTQLAANRLNDIQEVENAYGLTEQATLKKLLPMVQDPVGFVLSQSQSSQVKALADALNNS